MVKLASGSFYLEVVVDNNIHFAKLKTVHWDAFAWGVHGIKPSLLEVTNDYLIQRLDARRHIQYWKASWLYERIGELERYKKEFWSELDEPFAQLLVAGKFKYLTGHEAIEPLFLITQVVGASYPTDSLFNIVLRVSSREIVKALLQDEAQYKFVTDNYNIELTVARPKI